MTDRMQPLYEDNSENARIFAPDALDIPDFCDMDQFEQMMKNWAASTGLATVAVGRDGKYISGSYNFTDFCQNLTRKSPEGLRRCIECDRKGKGTYLCHAGLVDFASPITLDDGRVLGSIIGGQVLPEKPDEQQYRATARELGIDEEQYICALRKVNIRTREEIRAAASLLSDVVNMFVRTSYAARASAASLTEKAGIILSLGRIYFCDYDINLDSDTFLELDAEPAVHDYIGHTGKASELPEDLCSLFVADEFREDFLSFADPLTLKERMDGKQSITHEFISRDNRWCRAIQIAVNRDREGVIRQVVFALQDIQEEKKKEHEIRIALKEAADEANRANRAKTDFLSRISHDIRTPLNGIIGMTYLAGKEKNPPRTTECLAKIDTSSKFLLSLINDILDMTKAESEKIVLHPEPYPLEEFYEYLASVIRPLCQEKNQKFKVVTCVGNDFIPVVDKLRINQIVFNLLSNAVKYTPEGGTITYQADIHPTGNDGQIAMTMLVKDTGIGISKEFQKSLFLPFTQEGRSDTAQNRGSGLGLAIVKKLVDVMGGTIRVESSLGEGSCFTVCLTADSTQKNAALQKDGAGRQDDSGKMPEGLHALLCEDHPLNQEIARALLEEYGMLVETAENGQQGVEKFWNSPNGFYDVILMDIRMPVLNGYEATRKIRSLAREDAGTVPIVAMTADAFSDDVQKCLESGMDAHVAKPIDPALLRRVLEDVISQGR